MNPFARSSLAIGPNTRVPRGALFLSIITAAFSSNLIEVPSALSVPLLERTTTAVTTSPFFTLPSGSAFLTEATITSPTLALLFFEPPRHLIHILFFAPELSATFKIEND